MAAALTLAATVANLGAALDFVAGQAEALGLSERKAARLAVALEEAYVNVCNYAYPAGQGDVTLTCAGDGEFFQVSLRDAGIPFDILDQPEPDIAAGVDDRPIGGLGGRLIRELSDRVAYRREAGDNVLTLAMRRERPEGQAGLD